MSKMSNKWAKNINWFDISHLQMKPGYVIIMTFYIAEFLHLISDIHSLMNAILSIGNFMTKWLVWLDG